MTAASYTPPPPPPPPAASAPAGFDFAKPITFVFEDPEWVKKILIGGLFTLLGFLLIGQIFIFGYLARLVRNVAAGVERPLPEWDQMGNDFSEGLKMFLVALVYYIPFIGMMLFVLIPAIALGNTRYQDIAGAFTAAGMCLLFPFIIVLAIILPVALLRVVMNGGSIAAGFQFGAIFSFIKANIVNYLLAIAVYIVTQFVAQFGIILCCVGLLFTAFWSQCATAHAMGQMWRLRRE